MQKEFLYPCTITYTVPRHVPIKDANMIVVDKAGRVFPMRNGLLLDVQLGPDKD